MQCSSCQHQRTIHVYNENDGNVWLLDSTLNSDIVSVATTVAAAGIIIFSPVDVNAIAVTAVAAAVSVSVVTAGVAVAVVVVAVAAVVNLTAAAE